MEGCAALAKVQQPLGYAHRSSFAIDAGVRGDASRGCLSVDLDQVGNLQDRARNFGNACVNGDGIAEANGLSIAHVDLNDSQVETVAMHLRVIVTTVCEERHPGLFEPR